jgi:hypothetical protein
MKIEIEYRLIFDSPDDCGEFPTEQAFDDFVRSIEDDPRTAEALKTALREIARSHGWMDCDNRTVRS